MSGGDSLWTNPITIMIGLGIVIFIATLLVMKKVVTRQDPELDNKEK